MEDISTSLANIKKNYTRIIDNYLDSIANNGLNGQREDIGRSLEVLNANFKDTNTKILANSFYMFMDTASKDNYLAYIPPLKENLRLYNLL